MAYELVLAVVPFLKVAAIAVMTTVFLSVIDTEGQDHKGLQSDAPPALSGVLCGGGFHRSDQIEVAANA